MSFYNWNRLEAQRIEMKMEAEGSNFDGV